MIELDATDERQKKMEKKDEDEKEKRIFGGKDFADKELCSEEKSC